MAQQTPIWALVATSIGAIISPIAAYLIAERNIKALLKNTKSQIRASADIAKSQIQANIISSNRQKWIDTVRDDVAQFCTDVEVVRSVILKSGVSDLREKTKSISLTHKRLKLRLNPNKTQQKLIVDSLDSIFSDIMHEDTNKRVDELIRLTQQLIKIEWERVKSGG